SRTLVSISTAASSGVSADADILQSNIELSQERIDRAIINAKYAQGNDLSVLQARVDLNTDSIDYQNQQRNIDNAKEDLRNLMNEPKGFTFSTQALTTLPGLPTYDQLVTSATQQNPEVLLAQQGIVVEQQQLKILQADNRPQVTFSANAGLFRQDFEVGQLNYSQNIGVTGQIGIRYQVFDGKKRKRNQDIQRLHIQIKEEEKYIAIQEVLTNLEKSWNTYHTIKSQMDFEQRNLPFYEDNLALLRKNYKIGKANDTDLRSAQLSLTSAQISLSQKAIEQQMEHFKLLQLAGMLIQYPSQTREGLE
ncbi:MAG: TolC family protein, partial [Bacteroidota bacterium]